MLEQKSEKSKNLVCGYGMTYWSRLGVLFRIQSWPQPTPDRISTLRDRGTICCDLGCEMIWMLQWEALAYRGTCPSASNVTASSRGHVRVLAIHLKFKV